jgi:hypothetical protein
MTLLPLFSNIKNIIIGILCLLLIGFGGYAFYEKYQINAKNKTIEKQKIDLQEKDKEIVGKNATIEEYKHNIELAKQHQVRVVTIEKRGSEIQQSITKIKSRDLTDEEKIVTDDITDLFNGMQSPNSDSRKSGQVLSGSAETKSSESKNSTGVVK